jgi:tetratricopeptide (TPR) repeat protein
MAKNRRRFGKFERFLMKFFLLILIFASASVVTQAQNTNSPLPPPRPSASPTPKLSELFAGNSANNQAVSRERREQAYAKLLEGQRFTWNLLRSRSQAAIAANVRQAKQAFRQAVEFDPTLAEAYTALAELTVMAPPHDADEAIALAEIAVKLNPDHFGARRILARLNTHKSGLGKGELNPEFTAKAISGWKEITRLDPRFAEGWAFLSAFYEAQGKTAERIDALNRWLGSATPIDTGFYQNVFGREETLTPDRATVKLGSALIAVRREKEAVEILSRAIADNPQNDEAIELLRQALESTDAGNSAVAIESLQQAVFANPENISLIQFLAQIQADGGRVGEAAKTLREAAAKIEPTNKNAAAALQIKLGDIYAESDRHDEAIAAYQNALLLRGIEKGNVVSDDARDFAINVYDKIIRIYKNTNRTAEAKTFIENSRPVFGDDDLFADRQIIEMFRETGKKQEALQAVRAARVRFPDDYSLLRIEASILTELGRVDEGVKLIQPLIGKQTQIPSVMTDDFVNYLFISGLYSQAKRGKEAIEAANQAYSISRDSERRQIARLTLATAQQMSGDFKSAETTLRDILKQSPGNPIALNNLGYFLLERDEKITEAYNLIKQAVRIDPTNPSYLDSLGWAYFKMGNLTEAEKYLKQAAKYDSSSATIQEHLGDVYQKQGKSALAKTAWQKALTLASDAEEINRIKLKLSK